MILWGRVVKFGFRLLYHEMAFTYDMVSNAVSLGTWREWQRDIFTFLPQPEEAGIILELAHGTGDLQYDLAMRGYRTVGLDISTQMGKIAWRKLVRAGISPSLVRGSGLALPFASSHYRAVVCTFPTSFIFELATLWELYRILHPQGQAVILLNGEFTKKALKERLIDTAYALTNQRTPDMMQMQIEHKVIACGLIPEWHHLAHQKSKTTLLILKRG